MPSEQITRPLQPCLFLFDLFNWTPALYNRSIRYRAKSADVKLSCSPAKDQGKPLTHDLLFFAKESP